jgi:hypothetical protein
MEIEHNGGLPGSQSGGRGDMGRLTRRRVGAAGSVRNESRIVCATEVAAWLIAYRPAVGHGSDGDIAHGRCVRLDS